jgi:hypothetical protein
MMNTEIKTNAADQDIVVAVLLDLIGYRAPPTPSAHDGIDITKLIEGLTMSLPPLAR